MTHSKFPSPANDYIEHRIDLNREFVSSPMSTDHLTVVWEAPVARQLPGYKSGRPSDAELSERSAWRRWAQIEGQLARDWWMLRLDQARKLWPLFRDAVARWAPDEL